MLLCIYLITLNFVDAVEKTWVANWDLHSSRNWKGLPCFGKRLNLQARPSFAMFVDGKLEFGELMLPRTGEVVIGENGVLEMSPESSNCQDQQPEALFMPPSDGRWLDPDSWSTGNDAAIPDVNRVPCPNDVVVLPTFNRSMYKMVIPREKPIVAGIKYGGKSKTTSEFYSLATSTEGRKRIYVDGESNPGAFVYVDTEDSCTDVTGCVCHSERVNRDICRIKSSRCPDATCAEPINATGFCCNFCGAEILLRTTTLTLQKVKTQARKATEASPGTASHASKMADGHVHVYFVRNGSSGGDYVSAANLFLSILAGEKGGKESLVHAKSSSGEYLRLNSTTSNVNTIVIVLVIIIAIVAAGFFFYQKREVWSRNVIFQRLDSLPLPSRRGSVVPESLGLDSPSRRPDGGLSFENPVFSNTTEELTNVLEVRCEVTRTNESTSKENPLYGVDEQTMMVTGISMSQLQESKLSDSMESVTSLCKPESPPEELLIDIKKTTDISLVVENTSEKLPEETALNKITDIASGSSQFSAADESDVNETAVQKEDISKASEASLQSFLSSLEEAESNDSLFEKTGDTVNLVKN